MASDSPTSRSAAPPLVTANMTPEEEAAAREEARKARKREMGRERQRRKRLRDKAKREVCKNTLHSVLSVCLFTDTHTGREGQRTYGKHRAHVGTRRNASLGVADPLRLEAGQPLESVLAFGRII
jgi:hypothetical protein